MRWAGVVSRWVALAQAGVALPDDGEGGRWKRSIQSIVGLHAIVAGLGEAADWPAADRAYALDAAGVGIAGHRQTLARVWAEGGAEDGAGIDAVPASVAELLAEAEGTLERARGRGG